MIVPHDVAAAVVDPKAYADGRIDQAFAWFRREAPFAKIQPEGYDPFWVVTRHADIQAVELASDVFVSSEGAPVILPSAVAESVVRQTAGAFRTVVTMDNPEHGEYRKLTQGALLPQTIRHLEPKIRDIARAAVDGMAAKGGRCDFATDVAFLYPLRVILALLGVPDTDEAFWLQLTQSSQGARDKRLTDETITPEQRTEALMAFLQQVMGYFAAVTEDRRRCPRQDLASVIANGQIQGAPIGSVEAMGYYVIFATAGHDTTSASTAGGMLALLENPDQFAKLKADPALIPGHVEESIRWVTPVKHFARTAKVDTEFGGQKVAKGDRLMLCYASGTRDESVFEDPFSYQVARAPNRHVAFGYGPHLCLGQHLARMEMRILWEELLPRLLSVELDGVPVRPETVGIAGPKSVPIRFEMR